MIRKISIAELLPGMYVVDLHRPWYTYAFWRRRFLVRDLAHVKTIAGQGIVHLSIDTTRGIDLPAKISPQAHIIAVEQTLAARSEPTGLLKPAKQVSLGEERRRAIKLLDDASRTVFSLMSAARTGQQVEAARLEPIVLRMIESVMRNPDALVPLARLKQAGTYATEHAVATTGLMIAMGIQQGLSEPEMEHLALGSLVKDVGQAAMDARLITKPGSLSRAEFSVVKNHVEEGLSVLEATARLPERSVAVILEHHERFNGSGYPYHMAGDAISIPGRMAAIVDTYDALTSQRPYRAALSPSAALAHLFQGGGTEFDPTLVATFVHTIGVYPVGTLVLLESGHLAVVDEVDPNNSLQPIVRVIYHAGRRQYVTPALIDTSRKVGNHYGQVIRAESFERWGISPQRWQPG